MDNSFLKTAPVGKLLIKLGLPMMASMLVNSLYNIIDSLYVARLGTGAVAALSVIFPLQNLSVAVSVGLGVGMGSFISRLSGAGKEDEAEEGATTGLVLSVIHFFIFVLFGLFLIKPYLSWYALPESTLEMGLDYGRIVLCFSLPYLLFLVFEKLYQALGWMKTAMTCMLTGAVVNIILDPIFIFGFGLPGMGVSGAAIATVIGQTAALTLAFILYKVMSFPLHFRFKSFHLRAKTVKDIYNVALPAGVTLVLPSVLVGYLNYILSAYSEVSVAVLGIYYKLQTFFYMPASGLIQGMRPLLSYNYGAGLKERSRRIVYFAFLYNGILLLIGTLILEIFPQWIMSLFGTDQNLTLAAIPALRIIALGFIPSVVCINANGVFEAIGRGFPSLMISLTRQVFTIFPIAYFLSLFYGPLGVWASFPVSEILSAVITFFILRLGVNFLGGKNG